MCGMIEWEVLPRGTLRLQIEGHTADVWRVGNGARWHVDNGETYIASGESRTIDAACEAALLILEMPTYAQALSLTLTK